MESVTLWWMSANATHPARQRPAAAHRPRHPEPITRDELERQLDRLHRENERLRQQVADQQQQIAEQQQQIANLERQLADQRKNSTNSSKPPSSDGLAGEPRERRRKTGQKRQRRPGGQPGHPGHHRQLVPPEQVSETKLVLPTQCRHCHQPLPPQADGLRTEGEPRRHQVTELPPIRAHVTEYQCPQVVCAACGKTTQAPLPEELAGHFGPQLTALIAYWTVVCRLPRRVVEVMLADVLGIDLSLGSTQKAWEEVSQAVAQPYNELQQQLPQQAVLHVDETGWRTNGDKRWIWAFVAARFIFYVVGASRGTDVLVALLGSVFQGILCNDRLPSYLKYHAGKMQLCWAHLIRSLRGIQDHPHSLEAEHFARDALQHVQRLFRLVWRFRQGELTRQQLIVRSRPIRNKIRALAVSYWDSCDNEVANMANAFGEHYERLFCFLFHAGVEPTNNRAERALRTAVQWRKIAFGNRSREGEIAVGRLLTVTQTCRLQQRPALDYLTTAVQCHRRRIPVPSLLA